MNKMECCGVSLNCFITCMKIFSKTMQMIYIFDWGQENMHHDAKVALVGSSTEHAKNKTQKHLIHMRESSSEVPRN